MLIDYRAWVKIVTRTPGKSKDDHELLDMSLGRGTLCYGGGGLRRLRLLCRRRGTQQRRLQSSEMRMTDPYEAAFLMEGVIMYAALY